MSGWRRRSIRSISGSSPYFQDRYNWSGWSYVRPDNTWTGRSIQESSLAGSHFLDCISCSSTSWRIICSSHGMIWYCEGWRFHGSGHRSGSPVNRSNRHSQSMKKQNISQGVLLSVSVILYGFPKAWGWSFVMRSPDACHNDRRAWGCTHRNRLLTGMPD